MTVAIAPKWPFSNRDWKLAILRASTRFCHMEQLNTKKKKKECWRQACKTVTKYQNLFEQIHQNLFEKIHAVITITDI